ncbi:MAG: serine hydrolase domain-containing protein [Burkholderiaceae bacterium]
MKTTGLNWVTSVFSPPRYSESVTAKPARNPIAGPRTIFFGLLLVVSTPGFADHFPAKLYLQASNLPGRTYADLAPAKTVRALPEYPREKVDPGILRQAKDFLGNGHAFSLILMQDGQIVFEGYANDAGAASKLLTMSASKSMTSLAIGEALCAGKIRDLDEIAQSYAPSLRDTAYGRSSVANLLKMASGALDPGDSDGVHSYEDLGRMTKGELTILDLIRKYGSQHSIFGSPVKAGERYAYNNLDTEALGKVIEEATGISLPRWFEVTVWQKAGAEAPARWQSDHKGSAIAAYGMNLITRDFARIGQYAMDQLSGRAGDGCMAAYLKAAGSKKISRQSRITPAYGYQFPVDVNGKPWMYGHGGQMIGMNPETGKLLVTMGYRGAFGAAHSLFNDWALKP